MTDFIKRINWKQEEIKMYGKTFAVPRLTAWNGYEGFNYSYSGIMCNHFMPEEDFNSVLLNLYRNGNGKVSWHSDEESVRN